jgi:hypothetical protein
MPTQKREAIAAARTSFTYFLRKKYEIPDSKRSDARGPLRPIEAESGLPRFPRLTPDFESPTQEPLPNDLRL